MNATSASHARVSHAKVSASKVVRRFGGRFSAELGIDVASGDPAKVFQWFLAAILFGARISETVAIRTYGEFSRRRLLNPRSLLRRGWDGLVEALDAGGYVRYDFKTATKLLAVSKTVLDRYQGDLNRLHTAAIDSADLEQKLKSLAKGIGDVTVNIFLRELRGVWRKAEPLPSALVLTAAADLRLLPRALKNRRRSLEMLQQAWIADGNRIESFPDFEAALIRHGLELRRRASRSAPPQRSRGQRALVQMRLRD